MKKIVRTAAMAVFLCLLFLLPVYAASPITVFVNDLEITPDVPPYITSGRTMLPARAILEPLGAQFAWNSKSQTVTISKDRRTVSLVIGRKSAMVNGIRYELEAAAVIRGGRTFLPLRFVAEVFDASVQWNGADRSVRVYGNGGSGNSPMIVTGYYFDANSLVSLQNNLDIITDTIHFSYKMDEQGRIVENPYFSQGFDLARQNGKGIEMLVFANDRAQLKNLLNDPAAQKQVIDDIYGFLQTRGFDGVNMDFEYVDSTQSSQYVKFIKNLKTKLGGAYSLSLSVPARTSDRETWYNGYDYTGLAAVADRIMVMAYDQHWKGGEPGPVAGNDWVESVINYLLPKIPKEKFQLGLGAYGYDWPTGANGKTILIQAARDLAKSKGITVIQDPASGVSTFNYTDDSGIQHQVWFEDTTSILAKLELVKKYDLQGIAIWRLGIIPDNIWQAMKSVIGN